MPSFDIVSQTDLNEVDNALAGVMREIDQRYDFKGSQSKVSREDETIVIIADDDLKLKQVQELVKTYFVRRNIDPASLEFGKSEAAAGQTVRQNIKIKQGIDRDLAKKIIQHIKASKTKVQVSIQGEELRVCGKKRDDLQDAISLVKEIGIQQPLQYQNFRD